jgi:tetratricopeptide (TPR) repeat protein
VTNPSPDPLVGRTVGQYEIVSRLGGGGMGVVYRALDRKLGRPVAVKFLPSQWSHDEDAKRRFIREAQAASATLHPNICTIHDIETADDGQLFIVMAYYEGQTLKQRLERGPLPIEEALDIATQIADGLAKAHAQGVVHRDIKPGNLILTEDGVRIVDFGLATFVDALQLTTAGSPLGTAAYMSPEQARGEDADARTDVWATGVVLYEMLSGHVPFRGSHTEAIAYAIRTDPPPPLRAERPEIPEEVEQLVFRALHKDPAIRFPGGRELARALRQARGFTVPQDLRTQSIAVPAQRAVRRPRRLGRMALALVLAALAGVPAAWWALRPGERTLVVVAPVANQTGSETIVPYRLALAHALEYELRDSPNVRVAPFTKVIQSLRRLESNGTDMSSREALEVLRAATGASIVILPTLIYEDRQWRARVEIFNAATMVPHEGGTYETSPAASALDKETAHRLIGDLVPIVQEHFNRTPWRSYSVRSRSARLGTLDAAKAFTDGFNAYEEQEYMAASAAFELAAGLDPINPLLRAWVSRAAMRMRRDGEAASAAIEATRLVTRETPDMDRLFIEAVSAEARKDAGVAEARHRELVRRYPDDVTWQMELAAFQERRGYRREDWIAAVQTYQDVAMRDAGIIRPHLELCRLYNLLQEPQKAKDEGGRALAAYQEARWRGGEALARFCLVDVLRTGNASERKLAEEHASVAAALLTDLEFDYNLPRAFYYQGLAAGEQGRLQAAIELFDEALRRARDVGNHPLEPIVLGNLGTAHDRSGSPVEADAYYSSSGSLYERLGDERRAARQQLNRSALRIAYGEQPVDAFKALENALEVVHRLGDADAEVTALETKALYHRLVGQFDDADGSLNLALNLAKQHNFGGKAASVTLEIGRLRIDRSDYAGAKAILTNLLAPTSKGGMGASGRFATQARMLLGRADLRLGDAGSARKHLETARSEAKGDAGLLPRTEATLGELEYELGSVSQARSYFERVAAGWRGAFTPEPMVEARAYAGLLEAIQGSAARGRIEVEASLTRAQNMARRGLVTLCRVFLARVYLQAGEPALALSALEPAAKDAEGLGVELRAQVHYWRGRALRDAGDVAGSAAELTRAREFLDRFRESLPEADRDRAASRRTLSEMTR